MNNHFFAMFLEQFFKGMNLQLDISFAECALNRYGENCANDCLCEQANTQSCDKVNGSCTCKDGWQGTNCTDDVLECSNTTICGSNANCSETEGSYTCVCNVGYKKNSGGSCIGM